MDAQTLTSHLQEIRQNNFEPLTTELIKPMLEHLGSTNPILRDKLIYATFLHWIELKELITHSELRQILLVALDQEHLWWRISEPENDGVFKRSFSVLLIPLILTRHRKASFLTHLEIQQVKAQILDYLQAEKDNRGWTGDNGWAHSVAHTADALSELVLCPELAMADLIEILGFLQAKIADANNFYLYAEEERLAQVVDSVVERNLLSQIDWQVWLENFVSSAKSPSPENFYEFSNPKNFLQSMLVLSHQNAWPEYLTSLIVATLTDCQELWKI